MDLLQGIHIFFSTTFVIMLVNSYEGQIALNKVEYQLWWPCQVLKVLEGESRPYVVSFFNEDTIWIYNLEFYLEHFGLKMADSGSYHSWSSYAKYFAKAIYLPFQCCDKKPEDPPLRKHTFRPRPFRRPRNCCVCKLTIWNQGIQCTVCKYVCHKKCEILVMPSCIPQATYGQNNDPLNRQPLSRTHPLQGNRGNMNNLKQKILRGAEDDHDGLSVTYITERIIAMSFPADGQETTYKFHLNEVNKMLKTKHGDNYMIVNLSEQRDDLHRMNPKVMDFGWPSELAPPLERVCSICKAMDKWLSDNINRVVVVHCKGTQGRTGVILAAFMHYCNICASADQALDRFAMKRFYDDKLASLTQPSQRRYVHYFAGLLSGAIKINSNPLYLHHILIHGVPNFDTKGGCRPFIKIYQAMQPVFTSGVYNVTDNMQKICISIQPGIPLKGDILIKCYHKKMRSGQREVMWRGQFHTCAISDYSLIFSKSELDDGCIDPRFPENGKVEMVFSPREGSLSHDKITGFKSDVTVPVDEVGDALVRWDSYENFKALLENNTIEDLKENGLPPGGIRFQNFNVTEFKNELPLEDLYARVQKRRVETPIQNGTSHFENGSAPSHVQNQDSGYPGYRGNDVSSSYSTTSRSYEKSGNELRSRNDSSQLDDILKDLVQDQSSLPTLTRNKDGSQTKTWTTTSYGSSADIPQKVTVQRSETTFNQPGFREERVVKTSKTVHEEQKSERPVYIPKNAFSYTPVQSIESSRSFQSIERDSGVRSPSSGAPTPPIRTHTLPYRTDFENKSDDVYLYRTMDGRSDPGHSSWLQQQQNKLRTKTEGNDLHERSRQEKRLVAELKGAQSNYMRNRTESDVDELDFTSLTNGPVSTTSSFPMHRSASVGAADDIWTSRPNYSSASATLKRQNTADQINDPRYDGGVNTHTWTQETYFTTNGANKQGLSNKPPPSPGMQRAMTPASAPITPPIRGSSRDVMRQRTTSGPKDWQPSGRPLQRQFSDRSYDRTITKTSSRSTANTPPLSPRSYSPIPPQYQTSYNTYSSSRSDMTDKQFPYSPEPRALSPTPPGYQQLVTEVHVHRPGVTSKPSPDHLETTRTLDELEKLLHSSAASISQPSTMQRSVGNSGYSTSEESSTFQRNYETRNTVQSTQNTQQVIQVPQVQAAIPPREKRFITEETESISLMPIGPGLQVLEPDNAGVVTVTTTTPRATTPGFPSSPATPPFPVSPRTPYVNQVPYSPSSQISPVYASVNVSSHDIRRPFQTQISHHSRLSEHDPLYASIPEEMGGDLTGTPIPQRHGTVTQTVQYNQQQNYTTQGGQPQMSTLQRQQHQQNQLEQQFQTQQRQQHQQNQLEQQRQQQAELQNQFSNQYQTQQQQQQQQYNYQTQNFHSGSQQHITQNGIGVNATSPSRTLHVDTSREYGGSLQRSPQSAGSPPSPGNLNVIRSQLTDAHSFSGSALSPGPHSLTGQSSPSVYFGLSRRGSLSSLADSVDIVNTTPRFVKDTSKYWYKANITREEAIVMLKHRAPGSFVVRDSNSFPGAFGLAIKVAQLPPNVQAKSSDPSADLVRHFLIEPTPKGVRLKGCNNEPVFGSLAALVYQHSITPLALPCKLALPETDTVDFGSPESPLINEVPSSAAALLAQGAACNVLFINSIDTESLTGPQAVAKAIKLTFDSVNDPKLNTTVVHFKVSSQGITLTDSNRKLFFRRHYPVAAVTFCGIDPEDRRWKRHTDVPGAPADAKVFGFVARKQGGVSDNCCHIFAELDPEQPASAIVNFVTKVMIGHNKTKS